MTDDVEPTPLNLISDRDEITLRLIDAALERDIPWAAIARAIGAPDKAAAKKRHRELQRAAFLRASR